MPYISKARRAQFENGEAFPDNAGELNYAITLMAIGYLGKKKECYQTYNDILGALEGAKLEMYRRATAPYEDEKIKENGDVY